jgi:O-antigen ligase
MRAGGVKSADTILERFQSAPEESALARKEFEAAAVWMIYDRPLEGVGLNNFSYVLTVPSKYREHFKTMAGEKQAGVAHHIYLLTAAEMGYPGLIVLVIVLGRFAWLAGRHAWGARSLEGTLLFGFFLGLCALHAVGFLEWTLRITPVSYLFVICCGICVALAEAVRGQRVGATGRSPLRRVCVAPAEVSTTPSLSL